MTSFVLVESIHDAPVIKVIGVGGGGGNAVRHMAVAGIEGVDFICVGTDAQALRSPGTDDVLHIGQSVTRGLGAASPEAGRQAAMEDRDRIEGLIEGTDLLFVVAGMGGGTGTGASPVIAEIAREMGVLTVAVVTEPFPFEGPERMRFARSGIEALRIRVDSLITIPERKLLSLLGRNVSLLEAFGAADDALYRTVRGIAELITVPSLIGVDFADVRTVVGEMGPAAMGSGIGCGDGRASEAARMALSSPLLEDIDPKSAHGILINITAGFDMAIGEFEEIGNVVHDLVADDAVVIIGATIDDSLDGELHITLVITGLDERADALARLLCDGAATTRERIGDERFGSALYTATRGRDTAPSSARPGGACPSGDEAAGTASDEPGDALADALADALEWHRDRVVRPMSTGTHR